MRKSTRVLVAGVATGLLAAGLTTTMVQASPARPAAQPPAHDDHEHSQRPDELLSPGLLRERAEKQEALNLLVKNPAKLVQRGESRGVQLPNGKWVQWGTPKTAKIFTLLAEFGDETPDGGTAGPLHNQIAEPDRDWDGGATDDNSTQWTPDFSQAYFQKMLFGKTGDSMSDFYLRQSGGRYTVDGHVTAWVKLPANATRYGKNAEDDPWNDYNRYGAFVEDSVNAWVAQQKAAGLTDKQLKDVVAEYDVWDRSDFDGDGNFDEPDGYLDHVQVIHSGEGEEAGGGAQGDDAIWSHSWSAFSGRNVGPTGNVQGGVQIGNTGIYVSRYTTEPENGGLGVFAHEYGHDIGLPDYYDTNGGDNGTGFWTLMSGGSWLNSGKDNIGDRPGYMGPNEKLFLGWLDYDTVELNQKNSLNLLGPAAGGSILGYKQATMVKLPTQHLTKEYTKPFAGQGEWWAGDADDLDASLSREIDLTGATTASVNAKAFLDTEEGYDYFQGYVSTDNGATWEEVGEAFSGNSNGWVDYSYDLSKYAGKKIIFRYNHNTDGGYHLPGVFLDNITVVKDGETIFSDDVESGDNGWTSEGFTRFNGTLKYDREHFYLVENRQYVGYDATLKNGPYVFPDRENKPNWVNHYAFNPGIVIWYVNGAFDDNNTSTHPGGGQALPVDARPAPVVFPGGAALANSKVGFDGAFSLHGIPAQTFHRNGEVVNLPARKGISVFNDSNKNAYWVEGEDAGQNSVQVAGAGVRIQILLDGYSDMLPALIKVTRK